jgi:hypothetical protein
MELHNSVSFARVALKEVTRSIFSIDGDIIIKEADDIKTV